MQDKNPNCVLDNLSHYLAQENGALTRAIERLESDANSNFRAMAQQWGMIQQFMQAEEEANELIQNLRQRNVTLQQEVMVQQGRIVLTTELVEKQRKILTRQHHMLEEKNDLIKHQQRTIRNLSNGELGSTHLEESEEQKVNRRLDFDL